MVKSALLLFYQILTNESQYKMFTLYRSHMVQLLGFLGFISVAQSAPGMRTLFVFYTVVIELPITLILSEQSFESQDFNSNTLNLLDLLYVNWC